MNPIKAKPKHARITYPTIFFMLPTSNSNNSDSGLKWFSAFASASSLILTGYITLTSNTIDNKLKDLESIKKTVEINQAQLAFNRDFKLKIYELCIQAIKEKDPKQEQTALVAVKALVTDNDDFRQGLVSILTEAKDPDIRKAAEAAQFVIEEDKTFQPKSESGKIFVDILYYQQEPETREVAQKLYDALKFSSNYQLGPTLKVLTAKRNTEANYQVNGSQIRYDKGEGEEASATKLQSTVNELLGNGPIKINIEPAKSGNPSPFYLSLFVKDIPK